MRTSAKVLLWVRLLRSCAGVDSEWNIGSGSVFWAEHRDWCNATAQGGDDGDARGEGRVRHLRRDGVQQRPALQDTRWWDLKPWALGHAAFPADAASSDCQWLTVWHCALQAPRTSTCAAPRRRWQRSTRYVTPVNTAAAREESAGAHALVTPECAHLCMHICMYVRAHTCTHTHTHTHTIYICKYVASPCTHAYTYIHMYICTCIQIPCLTHTHIHLYIYTDTHVQTFVSKYGHVQTHGWEHM